MKYLLPCVVVLLCLVIAPQTMNAQIRNSPHDLSSSSGTTGPKSTNTDEVCVFCHSPHTQSASTVLWNRDASGATYTVYSSPSMEQTVPQPGSASKHCLSCHDGTVAFNSLVNSPGMGPNPGSVLMGAEDHMMDWDSLGTDLSNDHPIGLTYATSQATDGYLRVASLVGGKPVVSYGGVTLPLIGTTVANGTVECTSCHDPHLTTNDPFLRYANTASQVCFTCHNK